jgi:hypothetical protein
MSGDTNTTVANIANAVRTLRIFKDELVKFTVSPHKSARTAVDKDMRLKTLEFISNQMLACRMQVRISVGAHNCAADRLGIAQQVLGIPLNVRADFDNSLLDSTL